MSIVKIRKTTSQQYNLSTKDSNTLYILTDINKICLGGIVLSSIQELCTAGKIPVVGIDGMSLSDGLISQSELQSIIELIGTWDEETVEMVRNASNLSYFLNTLIGADEIPEFDSEAYYTIGDICIYNNALYRFINAHHGTWNEADIIDTNFYAEFVRYYSGAALEENVSVQFNFDATVPSYTNKYITTIINNVSTQHLIDNTGLCQFTIPKQTQYTVQFPQFDGYHTITDRAYTAYLSQRAIEANYTTMSGEATEEAVTLVVTYTTGSGYPSGTVTVTDSTAGTTNTYNLDAQGKCTFNIPFGDTYTIYYPQISGYISTVSKTFTASIPLRTVESKYAPLVSGMFIMDANFTQYTYEQWVAAGLSGTDAKYMYFSSSDLAQNGAAFFFCIDDLRTTSTIPLKQWLNSNVQVTTLNNFGSRNAAITDFGVTPYDPNIPGSGPISNMYAIKSWIDNQAAQGMNYSSELYNYVITKDFTVNGNTYKAYAGTAGQWRFICNESDGNYGTLNQIFNYLHQTDSTIPDDLGWVNKAFWTSTQLSSTVSWLLRYGSLYYYGNYSKNDRYLVLCFYAL